MLKELVMKIKPFNIFHRGPPCERIIMLERKFKALL